jgi:hypothetical protein
MWLPEYFVSGFFAFRRPGPDREISTWFIAARKDNVLIQKFCAVVNSYWRNNEFANDRFPVLHRWLTKKLSRSQQAADFWLSWGITRILKLYPYFWTHYLFARMIREPASLAVWNATPEFDATLPHYLQWDNGLENPMTDKQKIMIETAQSPVFKLSWKIKPSELRPDSPISYLINREINANTDIVAGV